MPIRAVVFDFGGVLFDWNPDYLYRDLIPDAEERAWFLREVCNPAWNIQQDAGRSLAAATASKIAEFPEYTRLIEAFYGQWPKTLRGTLPEGMALLDELGALGTPLYGLTNWSAETYPYAEAHYPLLQRFRHIVVSGREGIIKPDPAIYQLMYQHISSDLPDIHPGEIAFIDDSAINAHAASKLGWVGIHHHSIHHTRRDLLAGGIALQQEPQHE
ncbi:HAD family hydrolase [Chitinilyticum piscinae]|uniref:HAD family phosphatase n=1 Tax=Chitinilyticum piscinae TaxID=2866724 RepID=A0A8J7K838_9NEIS|nr:HAD family phosphatase [Chitinilyticum piscinae]MBE9608983.1 HAD family phosphatase [Chitinilyticum piscinae]